MRIDLIAMLEKADEFFNCFKEGEQFEYFSGKSLIFFSVGNTDLTSRYEISNFLIDKGVDVKCLDDENESVLHVLLAQVKNDIDETVKLCEKFFSRGVDINILDSKNRVAFQYVINMKFTDEQLKPLYDLWFSQPYVELTIPNAWGVTPIELASKLPYRKEILKRMQNYVENK